MRKTMTLTLTAAALAVTLSGCGVFGGSNTLTGIPTTPAAESPSGVVFASDRTGVKADAPAPVTTIQGTDGSEIDRVGALAVDDIAAFWREHGLPGGGQFAPPDGVVSIDSGTGEIGGEFCGKDALGPANAMFCALTNGIGWDRAFLVGLTGSDPATAALTVIAHELGHSVDSQVDSAYKTNPVLVREQRADCYAGSYIRWVAEGGSPRFEIDPNGLDEVLSIMAAVGDDPGERGAHGRGVERMFATSLGFYHGAEACASIKLSDIEAQRANMPSGGGESRWDRQLAQAVAEDVAAITGIPAPLSGTCATDTAAWCTDGSGVAVNIPGLQSAADAVPGVTGDATGLARVAAAAVQPWLDGNDRSDDDLARTCAVGFVAQRMVRGDGSISLADGDLDEMMFSLIEPVLLDGGHGAPGSRPVEWCKSGRVSACGSVVATMP